MGYFWNIKFISIIGSNERGKLGHGRNIEGFVPNPTLLKFDFGAPIKFIETGYHCCFIATRLWLCQSLIFM